MLQMENQGSQTRSAASHPGRCGRAGTSARGGELRSLGWRLPSGGPAPTSLLCDLGGATASLAFLPLFTQATRSSFLGKWCPQELKSTH